VFLVEYRYQYLLSQVYIERREGEREGERDKKGGKGENGISMKRL